MAQPRPSFTDWHRFSSNWKTPSVGRKKSSSPVAFCNHPHRSKSWPIREAVTYKFARTGKHRSAAPPCMRSNGSGKSSRRRSREKSSATIEQTRQRHMSARARQNQLEELLCSRSCSFQSVPSALAKIKPLQGHRGRRPRLRALTPIQRFQPAHHEPCFSLSPDRSKMKTRFASIRIKTSRGEPARSKSTASLVVAERGSLRSRAAKNSAAMKWIEQDSFVTRDEMARQIDSIDPHVRPLTDDHIEHRERDRDAEPRLDHSLKSEFFGS